VLGFDPRWARFAPLTTSGLVLVGAIMALSGQILGPGLASLDEPDLAAWQVPLAVVVLIGVIVSLALFIVIPVVGYLVANWGFQLTHDDQHGSYHVRRGLLTTTETSLDRDRIRGLMQVQSSWLVGLVPAPCGRSSPGCPRATQALVRPS
jgi:putative membrane protein